MNLNAAKRKFARLFDTVGGNEFARRVLRLASGPYIRIVNYHDIAAADRDNFESHLEYYSDNYVNVTELELLDFLKTGEWYAKKPGVIVSFDDGMRSHFEIAAPLLEKYGLTGWFFVPAGWIEEKKAEHPHIAAVKDQTTLSLEQLRYLAENHVVGCHTYSHRRLSADVPEADLAYEIVESKRSLEEMTRRPVDAFCWVGGEEFTYSRRAAEIVAENYQLGFMTNNCPVTRGTNPLQLQRTNIEAENPLSLVRFQLSGMLDAIYTPKRRRVNRLTASDQPARLR